MDTTGPPAEPKVEGLAEEMEVEIGAGKAPESESMPTATIPPGQPADDGTDDDSELDDWEWIRHHDVEVLEMPPRDSARPDEWRARREALERKLAEWEASPEGIACNAEVDALLARAYQAHGLSSAVGELEFTERVAMMFKVDNRGPVASGRRSAVKFVTKEQLHIAWKAIEACMKERGRALSRAFGNFDKYVGLGWLLGDVLCGRLIDGTDAYRIGRRLGKIAPDLKAEFDAPLRRVGKRKYADDAAREIDRAAAAREEAELRRAPIEVDRGLEEEAAAIAAAALAAPEMPPPPPPPPPLPRPSQPPRRSERAELLKALHEAESVATAAEGAVAATKHDRDQAQAAWQYARKQASNPHVIDQIWDDAARLKAWNKEQQHNMDTCRARLLAAEHAVGAAEEAQFWAKHEAKEARIELDEYEAEQRRRGRRQVQESLAAKKWSQIAQVIADNNAMYTPEDPEYWEPDAWEYAQLHRMWKLED